MTFWVIPESVANSTLLWTSEPSGSGMTKVMTGFWEVRFEPSSWVKVIEVGAVGFLVKCHLLLLPPPSKPTLSVKSDVTALLLYKLTKAKLVVEFAWASILKQLAAVLLQVPLDELRMRA